MPRLSFVDEDLVHEDKEWEANNPSTKILLFSWVSYCCEDLLAVFLLQERERLRGKSQA